MRFMESIVKMVLDALPQRAEDATPALAMGRRLRVREAQVRDAIGFLRAMDVNVQNIYGVGFYLAPGSYVRRQPNQIT